MNRREAAEEPSMEDILASIRKIIADDPAAAAPLPLPQVSAVGFALPSKDSLAPAAAPQPSLTARLNDVFGTGSAIAGGSTGQRQPQSSAPRPAPQPRAAAGRSVMDDDLGDMLADGPPVAHRPEAAPAPMPTEPAPRRPAYLDLPAPGVLSSRPMMPAANARLTELRSNVQAPMPAAPEPARFDPFAAPEAAAPAQREQARSGPVVIASMAPGDTRMPVQSSRDGAYVTPPAALDQQSHSPAPDPVAPVAAARPEPVVLASSRPYAAPSPAAGPALPAPQIAAAVPASISASSLDFLKPAPRPAEPAPYLPPQVATTLPASPAADDSDPVLSQAALATAASVTAAPSAATTPVYDVMASRHMDPPVPPAETGVRSSLAPVAAVAGQVAAAEPVTPIAPPSPVAPVTAFVNEPVVAQTAPGAASIEADEAVASALGALAAGLAASSQKPEIVITSAEAAPPRAEEAPAVSSPPPQSSSVTTSKTVSVFSSPGSFVGGSALAPVSTSTLDDTAAELLRPMLRQWLDDNMPRIVERALRIELAETVDITPKADPKP